MAAKISKRLSDIVDALPLKNGMRVLEIGCGPGVMAREIVNRIEDCYVLAIDRSATAIKQAKAGSARETRSGRLKFMKMAVEDLDLEGEKPFDLVVAIRVGAFDGRFPKLGEIALPKIAKVMTKKGRFFIDGGDPLRELKVPRRK